MLQLFSFCFRTRANVSLRWAWLLAFAAFAGACGSTSDSDESAGPGGGSGGVFGSGGAPIGSGGAPIGSGGAPIGSGGISSGTGGLAPGSGGLPVGTGGASATGGGPGSGGTVGVDPSELSVTAYGANTTVGLEWPDVAGATGYTVYFGPSPGVTPGAGQSFTADGPGVVHRGLTNGTTYYYVVTATVSGVESAPSPEASATPDGEWVLEELGTGAFDDVLTGGRTSVPMDQRLHILLFPEGYTSADLQIFRGDPSSGANRENDVDRWIDLVFGIEPYSFLRDAFVVWYLPRASATRINGGDTAFSVPVTNAGSWATGSIQSDGETASLAWAALDLHPYPPTDFGGGGFGSVRNFTAAFLILDPNRNRAGLSGRAGSLRNPTASNQRLSSAFGVGHAHEFTHAFAGLRDEYMEEDFRNRTWDNTPTTNVVRTNVCGELPWAHLLEGGGINTTPELVGAFGVTEIGIHSELLCLLNGNHENGTYFSRDDNGSCEPDRCTLRVEDRMCNHCREVTAYRIFERSSIIDEHEQWVSDYRGTFYDRFGFEVPATVPQSNDPNDPTDGTTIYEACVDTAFAPNGFGPPPPPPPAPYYEGCVLVEP